MYYGLYLNKTNEFWETAEGRTDRALKDALMAKAEYWANYEDGSVPSDIDYVEYPIDYFKSQDISVVRLNETMFGFLNNLMSDPSILNQRFTKKDLIERIDLIKEKVEEQFELLDYNKL